MIRELLIKLLFRLLEPDPWKNGAVEDKRITEWLVGLYSNMSFREYFRKRDIQLLKTMGVGLSQDSYKIWLGQRLELLRLLQKVDEAYRKSKPKSGSAVRTANVKEQPETPKADNK